MKNCESSDSIDPIWGYGTEARGIVHPAEFDYNFPYLHVFLDRDWQVRYWHDNGTPVGGSVDFSASIPTGNDTGPGYAMDTDPTDSDPFGAIYDWDAPGLWRVNAPVNEIRRVRANFKAFATYNDGYVRASPITQYYVRISIQQTDSPSGNNWIVVNDVVGDNSAGYGTTELTWDLRPPGS